MRLFIVTAIAAALLATRQADAAQCCLAKKGETPLRIEVVAKGLNQPWGLAFLPDGSQLVTEKEGKLRRVVGGKVSRPIKGVPYTREHGQGGLLDVALDPDYATNQTIYLSYIEKVLKGDSYGTAVSKGVLNLKKMRLEKVRRIFVTNKKKSDGRHFGSRFAFAYDKTLLFTLGDQGRQMSAQDPFDHAGSVIRINRDGSVPKNNPFADGKKALPEIWSMGHRNPQGAAVHPKTGQLWTQSHGAAGGDEVNIARRGRNYGWPLISYGSNYDGRGFKKGKSAPGLEQPLYYWDPSIAPCGMAFYAPAKPLIPDWQGSLLVGALKGEHLSRLILDGDKVVGEERYLHKKYGRIRDVRSGPDGAVWILTNQGPGQLLRLTQE